VKKPLEEIAELSERLEGLEKLGMRHLIRYSGTEHKLRVLLEAKDAKEMNKQMDALVEFFQKALNA
jgi:phosphoglucosamine mutase